MNELSHLWSNVTEVLPFLADPNHPLFYQNLVRYWAICEFYNFFREANNTIAKNTPVTYHDETGKLNAQGVGDLDMIYGHGNGFPLMFAPVSRKIFSSIFGTQSHFSRAGIFPFRNIFRG